MIIKINDMGLLYFYRPRLDTAYSDFIPSACMGGDDVCRDACPFFGEPVLNRPGTDDKSGVLSLCLKDLDFSSIIDERII